MFILTLVALAIASIATCLSLYIQEEIVKVTTGVTAALFFLLTLIFAPWPLKILLVAIPLIFDRLNHWSAYHPSND